MWKGGGAFGRRVLLAGAVLAATPSLSAQRTVLPDPQLQVLAELEQPPGNLTVTPDGRMVLSLHQFYDPPYPVAEWRDGELVPFARSDRGDGPIRGTVLGLQADARGVVWMLDNTAQSDLPPQLVGWDTRQNRLHRVISLAGATVENSFINDLRVDLEHGVVYITDPAGGANAALVVVDLETGTARRVLQGHPSVLPEPIDIHVEGAPLRRRTPEGTYSRPRVGVDALGLGPRGEWLYYGPLSGTRLYRVPTAALRDAGLSAEALGARVEFYADRPITDGIAIDTEGNIYLGELEHNAIGVITPGRHYRRLVQDPRLSWVDDFAFSADGRALYAVTNRLHLSAPLNSGVSAGEPPFYLFRLRPLAPGR